MENLTIIAAIGRNNELGLDNNLIWKFKEFKLFNSGSQFSSTNLIRHWFSFIDIHEK